jgi:hypothetical protein
MRKLSHGVWHRAAFARRRSRIPIWAVWQDGDANFSRRVYEPDPMSGVEIFTLKAEEVDNLIVPHVPTGAAEEKRHRWRSDQTGERNRPLDIRIRCSLQHCPYQSW